VRRAQERESMFEMVEKRPDSMWRTGTMYSFRNEAKVYGSPMLDAAWAHATPGAPPDPVPALLAALRAVPPARSGHTRAAANAALAAAAAAGLESGTPPPGPPRRAVAAAADAADEWGGGGAEAVVDAAGCDAGARMDSVAWERAADGDMLPRKRPRPAAQALLPGAGRAGYAEGDAVRWGKAARRRSRPTAAAASDMLTEEDC